MLFAIWLHCLAIDATNCINIYLTAYRNESSIFANTFTVCRFSLSIYKAQSGFVEQSLFTIVATSAESHSTLELYEATEKKTHTRNIGFTSIRFHFLPFDNTTC